MKTAILTAVAALSMAAPAFAQEMDGGSMQPRVQPGTVTVNCYRGPADRVILDRGTDIFRNSLVAYGYTSSQATDIARRVCRDPNLVMNPDALRSTMLQIMMDTPPS